MSYDLRIAVKVDGCDKFAGIAEPEYSSPTYNLGKMFRACTGWDYKQGEYYRCSEVIGNIKKGIESRPEGRDELWKVHGNERIPPANSGRCGGRGSPAGHC